MNLTETKRNVRPTSLTQFFAATLRALADRLAGVTAEPPSVGDLRAAQRYDAEIALLDAEAEAERYTFTVGMLRERLRRLQP
jgi:hypothetical protein